MSHTLIYCTCKNRLGFSLLPFTLIPQYLEGSNWSISLTFSLFSLAFMISRSFQTVRRVREAWKWGNICSVSVSFVRVGGQIHPHLGFTSGEERLKYPLPRENKIGQMLYPRANKDNQIPTPYPGLGVRVRREPKSFIFVRLFWTSQPFQLFR